MKKLTVLLVCLLMLLCACSKAPAAPTDATETPTQPKPTESATQPTEATGTIEVPYSFVVGNVTLVPGAAFDKTALPEPDSVYEAPSCAFQGKDITYAYGDYEIVTYDEGKGEFLYSVYFLEPAVSTPEGLSLGDAADKVSQLYGEPVQTDDGQMVYRQGGTELVVIVQDDSVISIEYRLVMADAQ